MIRNFIILLFISAFWGLGYLFVKVGEKSISPVTEMVGRSLVATIALVILCLLLKRDLLGPIRKYKAFMLFSVLGVTIPWLGIGPIARNIFHPGLLLLWRRQCRSLRS